jgi:hypothetical protein
MKPRITVITIGIDDLEASLRFYRDGLGFPTEGIIGERFEYGAVVFIQLQRGLRLALWPQAASVRQHCRNSTRSVTLLRDNAYLSINWLVNAFTAWQPPNNSRLQTLGSMDGRQRKSAERP